MTHCFGETSEEKTRWASSQVVGESTAQTVTTKSIGVMADIPWIVLEQITQRAIATGGGKFHYNVKKRNPTRAAALKVNAKYQPRLVALEIDEIKAGG